MVGNIIWNMWGKYRKLYVVYFIVRRETLIKNNRYCQLVAIRATCLWRVSELALDMTNFDINLDKLLESIKPAICKAELGIITNIHCEV